MLSYLDVVYVAYWVSEWCFRYYIQCLYRLFLCAKFTVVLWV